MNMQFANGYGLLIAVNENKIPRAALPAVAKDVDALYNVLVHPERCGYLQDHVKLLKGENATRDGILAALAWLQEHLNADASGNATAVIYYTGHGHIEGGNYYLIPYDVDPARMRTTALRADDFAADVSNLKPKRLLVMLDCCHAAGMDVKDFAALPMNLNSTAIPAQLFMPDELGILPSVGAKGFEQLKLGAGRAVLSSSLSSQKSYLRKDKAMSIFTYHLIEALTGHAQPKDGAPEVLVSDVMSHVWRHVPESAKADWSAEQQPDYQVSGNFPIALLLGGKGLSRGDLAPDPLYPPQAPPLAPAQIHTGGGPYITGSVSVGGDLIGRDKIEYGDRVTGDKITVGDITGSQGIAMGRGSHLNMTQGISPHDLEPFFATLISLVQMATVEKREEAQQQVEALKQEAVKGKGANDERMARLINGITGMVPGAAGAVVTMFANPILAGIAGPITRFVLSSLDMK